MNPDGGRMGHYLRKQNAYDKLVLDGPFVELTQSDLSNFTLMAGPYSIN